jgi:hypothetical protein
MLWELYQHARLKETQQEASRAQASARMAHEDVRDLERSLLLLQQQVERLTLTTIAMAEILRDCQGVSEEQIEAKVREIDLRDGKLDGKLGGKPAASTKACASCGRPNGPRRQACLYCGSVLPEDPFPFGGEP